MKINIIVEKIVDISRQFSTKHNISIYQLLKDSGYFENYSEITIDEIKKELRLKPELVQFWLNYSEDKRTSGGWYFLKKDDHTFIVGNLSDHSVIPFNDSIDACAQFIRNEIEVIRK
jgi:hypothetical protein